MWWWSLGACVDPAPSTGEPAVDCEAVPAPPLAGQRIDVPSSEDLDFDRFGHVVTSDFARVLWSTRAGEVTAVVAGLQAPAGLRLLPSDDLMVADVTNGALVRIGPDGSRVVVRGDLNWPNGIAVLPEGAVLVTELSGARLWRIDPETGDGEVLADIERPNGVALEPGGASALVGTMTGEGTLVRVWLDDGRVEPVATGLGAGFLDGVGVDVCGNAYVADVEGGRLLRVRTDGSIETLAEATVGEGWTGLRWGSGVGGWAADRLYLTEPATLSLYELEVGVPSAW